MALLMETMIGTAAAVPLPNDGQDVPGKVRISVLWLSDDKVAPNRDELGTLRVHIKGASGLISADGRESTVK